MNSTTKRIGAMGTAMAAVLGAGVAFAAWTSSGSGVGSAASDSAKNVTFAGSTVTKNLYPGGSGSIDFTVANPNHYAVRLSAITIGHIYAAGDATKTDLTTTCALTYTPPGDYSGANFLIAGDAPAQAVVLTNALAMGAGADQTACAGKTFVVDTLAATATSS